MNLIEIIIVWPLASLATALLIGPAIHFGSNS